MQSAAGVFCTHTGIAPPLMPFISQCVVAVQRTFAQVLPAKKSLVVMPERVSVRMRLSGLISAK